MSLTMRPDQVSKIVPLAAVAMIHGTGLLSGALSAFARFLRSNSEDCAAKQLSEMVESLPERRVSSVPLATVEVEGACGLSLTKHTPFQLQATRSKTHTRARLHVGRVSALALGASAGAGGAGGAGGAACWSGSSRFTCERRKSSLPVWSLRPSQAGLPLQGVPALDAVPPEVPEPDARGE